MNFTGLHHLRNQFFFLFSLLFLFSSFYCFLLRSSYVSPFCLVYSNIIYTRQKSLYVITCYKSGLRRMIVGQVRLKLGICRTVLVSSMAIMVIQIVERKSCYRNVTRSTLILNNCQVFIHMGTITAHYYY